MRLVHQTLICLLSSIGWIKYVAASPTAQDNGLCSFIAATSIGNASSQHSMWQCNEDGTAATNPCGFPDPWTGCTCDGAGNVVGISITATKMTGSLPSGLAFLSGQLTSLALNLNKQLEGTIPFKLAMLGKLQTLILSGNNLQGTIPPALSGLQQLVTLNIGGNKLTGRLPQTLWHLSNLQTLSLYANSLTGPLPPQLGDLASLQTFVMGNNQFTGSIPSEFCKLTALTRFTLSEADGLLGCYPQCFTSVAIFNNNPGQVVCNSTTPEVQECSADGCE